jgi:uncharacterized protein DUF6941
MVVDALLCDAATVRDNLLHVLGAGITRLARPTFPAPLGLTLAMMLTLRPTEAAEQHKLRIVLQTEDGANVAELDGQFAVQAAPKGLRPGEQLGMPVVLDLRNVAIPKEGMYSLEILIDSQHVRALPFVAQKGPITPPAKAG